MMGRWFCEGVVVPMLTPFGQDGAIDLGCAGKMARRLAQAGTFVFLLGTTGEVNARRWSRHIGKSVTSGQFAGR
jgi:hypothetical protein